MAEMRLLLRESLGKSLGDEHAGVLRGGLAWFVHELMESQVTEQVGAALHEKSRQVHAGQWLPCRRPWRTRVGDLKLAIPRLRHFPSFLEPRSCSELALVAAVEAAHVNGVSTRKFEQLVRAARPRRHGPLCRLSPLRRPRQLGGRLPLAVSRDTLPLPLARRQGGACARGATCAMRLWSSPKAYMRRAAVRCSASPSARPRARPPRASSCAILCPTA